MVLTPTNGGHPRRVSELGEFGLIERLRASLDTAPANEVWSGDDTAVIEAHGRTLFTTDMLVEGVDFELAWASGSDVGWKALAINASDIAAMGGRPTHAVVGLALPSDTPVSVVDALTEGMIEAGRTWNIGLVGGDLSRGPAISVSVSMLGRCDDEPILRSGARVGDALCVTGSLGGAAAGLRLLQRGLAGPGPTEGRHVAAEMADACVRLARRQLRPRARVAEAAVLAALSVHAMIDVSDGLLADADRIAGASDAGWTPVGDLPVDPDVIAVADMLEVDPLELARSGGEDFELLFACDPLTTDAARAALEDLGTPVTVIGEIGPGRPRDETREEGRGWDHLRDR